MKDSEVLILIRERLGHVYGEHPTFGNNNRLKLIAMKIEKLENEGKWCSND